MKKYKSELIAANAILLLILIVGLVYVQGKKMPAVQEKPTQLQTEVQPLQPASEEIYVRLKDEDVPRLLLEPLVQQYVKADISVEARDFLIQNGNEDVTYDAGIPAELAFEIGNVPYTAIDYVGVEISREPDFASSRYYTLGEDMRVQVYHLETNAEYYYKLYLCLTDETEMTWTGTFQTEDMPRLLSIDGIRNVRDIGGWETIDGRRIRQSLLYRGTEADAAVEKEYRITEEGISVMHQILKIKTEMDLRGPVDAAAGSDVLGNVTHKYYQSPQYMDIFEESAKDAVRSLFSDLAKPEVYPVYLHCTYGLDRTGTMCCLLEALLGLDEEQLIKEYELSVFHHQGVRRDSILEMIDQLKTYPGESIQEKTENYLLSVGVTHAEIASIRNIFLENFS